jgi:hypothetical protein
MEEAMEKWEYITITYNGGKVYKNGEEISLLTGKYYDSPEFFDYLNQLGDDGWELVTQYWTHDYNRLTFKCPKK